MASVVPCGGSSANVEVNKCAPKTATNVRATAKLFGFIAVVSDLRWRAVESERRVRIAAPHRAEKHSCDSLDRVIGLAVSYQLDALALESGQPLELYVAC